MLLSKSKEPKYDLILPSSQILIKLELKEPNDFVEKECRVAKTVHFDWRGGEIFQLWKTLHQSCENPNDGPEHGN